MTMKFIPPSRQFIIAPSYSSLLEDMKFVVKKLKKKNKKLKKQALESEKLAHARGERIRLLVNTLDNLRGTPYKQIRHVKIVENYQKEIDKQTREIKHLQEVIKIQNIEIEKLEQEILDIKKEYNLP